MVPSDDRICVCALVLHEIVLILYLFTPFKRLVFDQRSKVLQPEVVFCAA